MAAYMASRDDYIHTAMPSVYEGKKSNNQQNGNAGSFSFWDVGGHRKTVKRCESGHKLLDDLMQFFQERGDIEKAYAKSLQQFSKKWRDHLDRSAEYGSNQHAWKAFLTNADKLADVHYRVKEQLDSEICDEVRKWTKAKYVKGKLSMSFSVVKGLEEDFKRAQKPWEKQLDVVNEARKSYFSACKSEKTAKVHYENAQRNSSSQTMEQVAKTRDKLDLCHGETQQTREAYREALAQLYSIRPRYQNEMTEVFKTAQRFEQERMMFFKTTFYRCHEILNIFSPPSRMNGIAEQLSSAIASADAVKDTGMWSARFGSDMDIENALPTFMEYSDANHAISRRGTNNDAANDGAVVLRSVNIRDPGEMTDCSINTSVSSAKKSTMDSTCSSVEKNRSIDTEAAKDSQNGDDDEDEKCIEEVATCVTVQQIRSPADVNEVGVRVWALYAYEAQENDELSFEEGDAILKLTEEDEQGWCKGKLLHTGQAGLYPAAYVSDHHPSEDISGEG